MNCLLAFGMPGPMELAFCLAILLLLFGSRLPSLMRNLGRGVVEFKKGVNGIEEDIDSAGAVSNDKDV
jgi:sec-independent protein translocase protein TatA